MNKKLFLFAPLLALAFIPKLVNTVNAATPTTETASYQDMVVRTAMNQGGTYSGTLVDYQIVHGNVANNNIQQFSTYVVGDSWTGDLGTEGDDAYCSHYQLFTQNNDGLIAKITAKSPVLVDVTKTQKGGWDENGYINVYKQSGPALETIKSFEITASTTVEEYNVSSLYLGTGDVLYYEFKFEWGGHRNMMNLPGFTFTETEEIERDPITMNYRMDTIIHDVASNSGNEVTSNLMTYGIYHGVIEYWSPNNVRDQVGYTKFDTYYAESGSKTASLGDTSNNGAAYVQNWKMNTSNNDGVIFKFTANENMIWSLSRDGMGSEFLNDSVITTYKYDPVANTITTVNTLNPVDGGDPAQFNNSVLLLKGQSLFWEFKFQWSNSRVLALNGDGTVGYLTFSATEFFHNPVHHALKDATCTENGSKEYWSCEHCEAKYLDERCTQVVENENDLVISAKGHKEVVDAAVAPTCTEKGKTEGKHCEVCGTVTVAQEEVAALGHKEVVDAAVAATCTETGLTEGKHCEVCNEVLVAQEVIAAAHGNVTHHEAVEATCTEAGTVEYYYCDKCEKNYSDVDLTVEVTDIVVPATGHSVSATKSAGLPDLENGTAVLANFCSKCDYHENAETIQGPTEYAAPIENAEDLAKYFEINDDYSYKFVFDGNKLTNANSGIASTTAYIALTAKEAGTFTFDTVTCTEVGYDMLIIQVNGSEKFNSKNAGGNTSTVVTKSHSFTVEAGTKIVFSKKADSSSFGKDSSGRQDYADIVNMKFVSKSAPADAKMILVSFETNSDATLAPVALFENSALTVLPTPEKEGYFFENWYADEALTIKYDIATLLSANTTIYAGYVAEADASPLFGHYKGYNVYGLNFANRESELTIDAVGRISGLFNGSEFNAEIVNYDAETGIVSWKKVDSDTVGQMIYDPTSKTFALKSASPQEVLSISTDFYVFTSCQETAVPSTIAFYQGNSLSIKLVEFVIDGSATKTVLIKDNKIYPNVTYTSLFTENPSVANMKTITDVVVRDAENNILVAAGYNGSKLVDLDSAYGVYTNAENTIKISGLGKIALNDVEGTYVIDDEVVKATIDGVYYHITLNKENGTYTSEVPMATVTYEEVEGTACEDVEVNLTMPVGELPTTTREGYVFMGWYDNAEYTGSPVTAEYVINEMNVTLYAKWLAKVTLTINTNEGTAIAPIDTAATLPIESPAEPTREGYRFDGYFCETTFENAFAFADGITEDTTIYVKWVKVWNVTINPNNGEEATVVVVDENTNYSIPSFVNPGSVLQGWFTTETFADGSEYVNGSAITADVTVYAKWEAGKYANDAANYIDAADTDSFVSTVNFETTYPWATASYNGSAWMVSTNKGKGSTNEAIAFTLAKNAIVSFDYIVNSESGYDYLIVSVNGTEVLSSKVSGQNGKDVTGNYTGILNAGDVISIAYKKDGSGDHGTDTAYVGNFVFETVEEVAVTYVYNDGTTANQETSISKGTSIAELPQPTREGYIFLGWYTDETCETKYEGQTIMAVTTLYAKWVDTASMPGLVRDTATTILFDEDKTYVDVQIAPNQTTIWVKAVVTETNDYRSPQMYLRPASVDGATLKSMIASVDLYKNDETTTTMHVTSFWSNTTDVWASNFGEIISTENAVANETVYYICITLNTPFEEMTTVGMTIYY